MMQLKSPGAASLLALSVFALGGCDQVEKSAQQWVGKATETAKQAIDDTHKAAEQALNDATQGLISNKHKSTDDSQSGEKKSQEI